YAINEGCHVATVGLRKLGHDASPPIGFGCSLARMSSAAANGPDARPRSLALRLGRRRLDMTPPLANYDWSRRAAVRRCNLGDEGCITRAEPTAPGPTPCAIKTVLVRPAARADYCDIATATARLRQADAQADDGRTRRWRR